MSGAPCAAVACLRRSFGSAVASPEPVLHFATPVREMGSEA